MILHFYASACGHLWASGYDTRYGSVRLLWWGTDREQRAGIVLIEVESHHQLPDEEPLAAFEPSAHERWACQERRKQLIATGPCTC